MSVSLDRLQRIFAYDANKGDGGGSDDGKKVETKTYTQEDLDRMIGERAERAKNAQSKAQAELLTALGVNSLEDAKTIIARQKEADDLAKTDLEKAQQEAKTAREAAEQIKAEQAKVLAAARDALMKAETLRQVIAYKDANGNTFRQEAVDDVWLVLDKASITDEDGGSFKGIKEAVEQVAKDRPHWLADTKQVTKPRGTPTDTTKSQKQGEDRKAVTPKRPFTL